GLELCPHQNGNVIEVSAATLDRFDLLTDPARFLRSVPDADHAHFLALRLIGPQRLAEPAGVMGDHSGSGSENVRRRAVVLFQTDDLRAGEVVLEAKDVRDLSAAPAVNRLIVVADAADVLALLGEQPEPEILGLVGILIFVDQDIPEALLVEFEDIPV